VASRAAAGASAIFSIISLDIKRYTLPNFTITETYTPHFKQGGQGPPCLKCSWRHIQFSSATTSSPYFSAARSVAPGEKLHLALTCVSFTSGRHVLLVCVRTFGDGVTKEFVDFFCAGGACCGVGKIGIGNVFTI
jgi:hypothetical protein